MASRFGSIIACSNGSEVTCREVPYRAETLRESTFEVWIPVTVSYNVPFQARELPSKIMHPLPVEQPRPA